MLQSMGSQTVRLNLVTEQQQQPQLHGSILSSTLHWVLVIGTLLVRIGLNQKQRFLKICIKIYIPFKL